MRSRARRGSPISVPPPVTTLASCGPELGKSVAGKRRPGTLGCRTGRSRGGGTASDRAGRRCSCPGCPGACGRLCGLHPLPASRRACGVHTRYAARPAGGRPVVRDQHARDGGRVHIPRAYPCQRGTALAGRCEDAKRGLSAPARHDEGGPAGRARALRRGAVAAGRDHRPDDTSADWRCSRATPCKRRGASRCSPATMPQRNAWPGMAASSWTASVNTRSCPRSHASSPTRSTPLAATRNPSSGHFAAWSWAAATTSQRSARPQRAIQAARPQGRHQRGARAGRTGGPPGQNLRRPEGSRRRRAQSRRNQLPGRRPHPSSEMIGEAIEHYQRKGATAYVARAHRLAAEWALAN